mmetsp:Transcript_80609/g.207479  ORF Transcript_80609/g.207479 Transcript_80609/m.207479 type:complete len:268 (+) Transcript_80609:541-1344(+)
MAHEVLDGLIRLLAKAFRCDVALCPGAADDSLHEELPHGLLSCRAGGARGLLQALRVQGEQHVLGPPELIDKVLELRPPSRHLARRILRFYEPVRQEAPQQLHVLAGLGQEAEPDNPGQDHEELDVAFLAHRLEGRSNSLRHSDGRNHVTDGAKQLFVLHVAGAHLPAFLPVNQTCDQAHVVAEMGVYPREAVLDLSEVLAHGRVGFNDVGSEEAGSQEVLSTFTVPFCLVTAVEGFHCVEEDIHAEVVTSLAADVGDGVEVCDGGH